MVNSEANDWQATPTEFTPLVPLKTDTDEFAHIGATSSSFISPLVFGWFTPILERGNEKKRLDPDDLEAIPLPSDCSTAEVWKSFEQCWQMQLEKEHPSLFRALLSAYGYEFITAGALKLVHDCSVFVGPQVLHALILFLRDDQASIWRGLWLSVLVTLSQLIMSICLRHYFFRCYTTGLRVRSAVVLAVYRKALVLSNGERQRRSLGEITNLMSIDAQRLQNLTTYLHAIWYSPLQISLALYFLWGQLGASSLGGVLIIVIMIPVTKVISEYMGRLQSALMNKKDERVDLNSEVLSSMKVVKLQAWEESFQSRILKLREVELKHLWHYFICNSLSRMLWTFTPLLVAVATFAAYVWSGHVLDVASALTALSLFGILRFPLAMLPQVINNIVEAMVAVNRVQDFLLSEEHKHNSAGTLTETGICLRGVSACYENVESTSGMDPLTKKVKKMEFKVSLLRSQLVDAEACIQNLSGEEFPGVIDPGQLTPLCLRRVNFECGPGELVAVVGGVGCGKSSILSSILGETLQLGGSCEVNGSVAYFSQVPFIVNSTVRENIIFGHDEGSIDEAHYRRAIETCALLHDLELLPEGDETEIGEKGVTLSGGQKARIALARAVYHKADLTLIDDALSAVDAHVAKHLFHRAIADELLRDSQGGSRRSVIFVTNAVQYLSHPQVSRILVVQNGQIVENGTYDELSSDPKSVFSSFLDPSADQISCEKSNTLSKEDRNANQDTAQTSASSKTKTKTKLITVESRQTGKVNLSVYKRWMIAAGGILAPVGILFSFAATEAITVMSNWWITYWSENGNSADQGTFLAIYALINVFAGIFVLIRGLTTIWFGMMASRALFSDMLSTILFAPMSFFDQTPVGRLVNRFSKDVYTIDEELIGTLRMYLGTVFQVASTFVVISGITPVFLICLVPIIVFYLKEQEFFTLSYREIKRIDSVSRSPIYAQLGESVGGVTVIRAFGAGERLLRRIEQRLNAQQHAYYLTCAAQSWLAVRLELIGTLVITFSALSAVIEHSFYGGSEAFAGLAGLGISYALSVTQSLNWSVRMASDLEANMVAVERIDDYCNVKPEAERVLPMDTRLEKDWPPRGGIEFSEVMLRYRPELPLTLRGINLSIPPKSRVGVVGRTGAGKSTLMVALMRIVETEGGQICFDGQDISEVGLARLRSSMAIIPQDPILFSGTIRSNLDPFDMYSDQILLDVLERVGLYSSSSLSSSDSLYSMGQKCIGSLNDRVTEMGSNFSVGQRQLLVITRALLQGAKIVVMDEATAAVDSETDRLIQKVMRAEFSEATCITVAHRINTILDSDFILVMSDGEVAEFGPPDELLRREGHFRDLVEASGQQSQT